MEYSHNLPWLLVVCQNQEEYKSLVVQRWDLGQDLLRWWQILLSHGSNYTPSGKAGEMLQELHSVSSNLDLPCEPDTLAV